MTLQIFWPKPGNPREGGQKGGTNGREGGGEGGSRAKPGNQLVYIYIYIYNTYSFVYRYETLYITQIDHPESNAHKSALHIWVILLKPGRYCDMEVDNLKFNISYFLYCR